MSSIGPQLPPHLSKRKRSPQDESPDSPPSKTTRPSNEDEIPLDDDDSDSDDGYGPSAPRQVGSTMPSPAIAPTRPSMGPAMPASTNTHNDDDDDDDDDDSTGPLPPPKRTHGPAPPPASLSERPPQSTTAASESDSGSDDDYGPALPTAASRGPIGPSLPPTASSTTAPERLQRDDWMLAPPSASAGYQERDPTKIKSRKFASGATATTRPKDGAAGGGISSIWTETPEEKAKRLADAVLGRVGPASAEQASTSRGGASGVSGIGAKRDEKQIRAFTEQTRGRSLYEEHQAAKKAGGAAGVGKKEGDEDDDDPSKRAFDREKDMGLGGKITASQRKELLNRASDFGGRFSKGNYL